ncbi:glomulin-like [Littorina saxatilis]|uniref:Glomulin n=1 Tax=Littorina saxatilis TaxID=31220 RepID=A0AAN9C0V8_9CAEN
MSLLQQIQDAACEMETDLAIPPVEDKEELLGRIAESVTAKDSRTLQAYVLEQRLPDPEQFWELTTLLAPCLTTENLEEMPRFFTTVRRCLTHFSRHGKPKEMVLALLEQIEGFQDDALFITLLPCLQNALLQLPVKRGRSLELALDTLGDHVKGIPAPQNWNLEGEETKLLESDETVRRFLNVVPAFLDFMQPFLKGVGPEGDGKGWQWERRVLRKHLLQLLEHPLVFLDLRYNSKENSPKTYSREIAETLVQCLTQVEGNFYGLLVQNPADGKTTYSGLKGKDKKSSSGKAEVEDTDMEAENAENELKASGAAQGEDSEEVQEELSQLSGATLAYLVQVEWLGQERWPKTHSVPHLFHANLPYAHTLLTNVAHTAVYKGLSLLSFYLDLMEDLALDVDTLDDDNVMPVVNAIIIVMRFCPIRQLRFSGLEVFKIFFAKLDCKGCHQLMRSVLASCEHAGVRGVVVGLIKNNIDTALRTLDVEKTHCGNKAGAALKSSGEEKPVDDRNNRSLYFFKDKLKQLLQLAIKLPEGAATDLLEQSDLIMATLNLLRYLVLRDSDNHTAVWDMLPLLEKEYFSALRTGLDMSEGHYKLELDNLNKQAARRPRKGEDIAATVSVAGTQLPPMTEDQRLNVMHSALTTFDMMKCVLARLSEIIDQKKNKA